jgi:hypothetical protein
MTGFNVMISYNHSIISGIFHHPSEKMLRRSIYIVVIICCIISLQAVTSIYQDYIFRAVSDTDTVGIPCDIRKRIACPVSDIERIEITSVDIICRKKTECIFTVLWPAA